MLPSISLLTLLSPTAGAVATSIGPRLPMTVGLLLVAAGTLLLAGVDGSGPYASRSSRSSCSRASGWPWS